MSQRNIDTSCADFGGGRSTYCKQLHDLRLESTIKENSKATLLSSTYRYMLANNDFPGELSVAFQLPNQFLLLVHIPVTNNAKENDTVVSPFLPLLFSRVRDYKIRRLFLSKKPLLWKTFSCRSGRVYPLQKLVLQCHQ